MNRTEKFIKNTLVTGIYQLVTMLTGFVLPKIILTYYGSETNGLVTSITQLIQYITLVEAGLSGAAVYALYKPLARKDNSEISGIVVAIKRFYTSSGWLFTALVLVLSVCYPIFVRTQQFSHWEITILVLIIGVNGTLDFFLLGKYRALLTADQKQYVISIASLVYCVLNLLLIACFAGLGFNIIAARFIAVGAIVARSLVLMLYCKKEYRYIDYTCKPLYQAINKRWDALALQILGTIHSGAPVLLATMLTSLKDVSVYAVFNMVASGVSSILSIFTSGLGAGFGELIAKDEKEALKRAYLDFEFAYYFLISFVYAVMCIQIMSFIQIYTNEYHDANYNQPILGFLFALNGFLFNIKTPQGMMVISAGLYKETRIQTSVQAGIAIVASALLGKLFGLNGILFGMCLSNLYRDIDLICFVPKYVTHTPIRESLKNLLVNCFGMSLTVISISALHLQAASYMQWFLNSILVSGVTFLVLCICSLVLSRKQTISLLRRVGNLLGKGSGGMK